jgi:hypothetical protein
MRDEVAGDKRRVTLSSLGGVLVLGHSSIVSMWEFQLKFLY